MQKERIIAGNDLLLGGNPNNFQVVGPDGPLDDIDRDVGMGRITDTVTWRNTTEHFNCGKFSAVRAFMLTPNNFELEPRSFNRSASAQMGGMYLRSKPPTLDDLK